MESLRQREAFLGERQARCGLANLREGKLASLPRITEISRASNLQQRRGILRVQEHLSPVNISGLECILGQGEKCRRKVPRCC